MHKSFIEGFSQTISHHILDYKVPPIYTILSNNALNLCAPREGSINRYDYSRKFESIHYIIQEKTKDMVALIYFNEIAST